MECFRQEYWVGCHFLFQGSLQLRDRTRISCVSCTAGGFLSTELLGSLGMQMSSPISHLVIGFHVLWLQPNTQYSPRGHSRDRGRWRRASSSGRGHCPTSAWPRDLGFISTSPRLVSEKPQLPHLWKECCPNSICSPSCFHESLIISREILRV